VLPLHRRRRRRGREQDRQEAQDGGAGGSRGRSDRDDHGRKQDAAVGRFSAGNGDDDVLFLDTEAKGAEGRCRPA